MEVFTWSYYHQEEELRLVGSMAYGFEEGLPILEWLTDGQQLLSELSLQ